MTFAGDLAHHSNEASVPIESMTSVSHFVRTLRNYARFIAAAMFSVAIAYAAVALALYLKAPGQRTTVQPFRLDFRGAREGTLPNGARFAPTEIVNATVLQTVFNRDDLSRFTTFEAFSRSVFVLEVNSEYERLVSDYQARLSDSRLSPADRDRLYQELELKKGSINKNTYALCYLPVRRAAGLPDTLIRKVLLDILNTWAVFAIDEEHALDYRVPVFSPRILDATAESEDPVIAIQVLRSKINRVIDNVDRLCNLPAAELMRTRDGASLGEIRMQLEDTVRFRLEPLVGIARDSGLLSDRASTTHFIESQLAYDQRRLTAAEVRAEAAREAMSVSTDRQPKPEGVASAQVSAPASARDGETVMPQINDTFLDRLIGLTRQVVDSPYRQKLIDDYQTAVDKTIPAREAVTYQQEVLLQVRANVTNQRSDGKVVRTKLQVATDDVRRLIGQVAEIQATLSRTVSPSTQLFSLNGPPVTRTEHAVSLRKLFLFGVFVLIVSFPLVVVLTLLHARMREEEGGPSPLEV